MIKVVFFASLREQLQCDETRVKDFSGNSVQDLLQHLVADNPEWQHIFSRQKLLYAVNRIMARLDSPVSDNDEVAFFPAVTGG